MRLNDNCEILTTCEIYSASNKINVNRVLIKDWLVGGLWNAEPALFESRLEEGKSNSRIFTKKTNIVVLLHAPRATERGLERQINLEMFNKGLEKVEIGSV
jgi:hypothetical protein